MYNHGGTNPPPYAANQAGGYPAQAGGEPAPTYMFDDTAPKNFTFDDASIRRSFIRKVYSILMVQLAVTFGAVALFTLHEGTKEFARRNSWLMIVALIVTLITILCMACCENVRRQFPLNFIFLAIFTIAESFLVGVVALKYAPSEILLAVGITAAICLALTIFAFQTKIDFTMMGGVLLAAAVVLLLFGILHLFIKTKLLTLIYSSCGALLFSIYLIYDTQLMMGGEHKYSISPEEYIFAALNLYLDVINIFLYILSIIGASRD